MAAGPHRRMSRMIRSSIKSSGPSASSPKSGGGFGRSGLAVPPLFKYGGVVQRGGMARVHRGESIAPRSVELAAMQKRLAGAKKAASGKMGYRAGPKRSRVKADFAGA